MKKRDKAKKWEHMPNISLRDTDDSLNIILPNGCEIKQLVVPRLPKVPEDRLYTISEDLWKLMDNDEKAGVILHEVIYREAIYSFKHTDSFHSRYLNSYISSHRVDNYTPRTFLEFLKNLEFYTGEIQGVEFYIGGTLPDFYDNGVLKSGRPARGSKIGIFGLSAELNEGAGLVFYGELSFYPNGVVESGRLARGLRQTYKTDWIEAFFDTDGVRVEFSPNGFFRDALRGVVSKRMRFGTGHDSDPSRQGFAPCSKT